MTSERSWGPIVALAYVPLLLLAAAWILLRDGAAGMVTLATGDRPLLGLAAGLGTGVAVSFLIHATPIARSRTSRRLRRFLRGLLGPVSGPETWILAVASGIAEEALFRGALQPTVGLIPASLIFGILHVPPDRRLLGWPVFATLAGLALGTLFDLTGGLIGPVTAHAVINLISLRRLARGYPASADL